MIQGLLWIFGSYGLCIVMVHLSYARFHRHARTAGIAKPRRYVLVTQNNQLQVEWYIRSLLFFSLFKGKEIRITILDEGSTDETLAIVRRLAMNRFVEIHSLDDSCDLEQYMATLTDEEIIAIPLSHQEDHRNVPLFQ